MADNFYIKNLSVTDSTNSYVRDNAALLKKEAVGASFVVVVADEQTAGRGQRGNKWFSHKGENLLMTILAEPIFLAPSAQFLLSQAVALAVCDTLNLYNIESRLKWPNDVYVGEGKIAGILVELDYEANYISQAIIGVGLNINQTEFAPMDRIPTSMKMLVERDLSVDGVMESLLQSFAFRFDQMKYNAAALCDEYKKTLIGWGRGAEYADGAGLFEAVIEDIEPDGHLLLRRTDGSLSRYAFKEVELKKF